MLFSYYCEAQKSEIGSFFLQWEIGLGYSQTDEGQF